MLYNAFNKNKRFNRIYKKTVTNVESSVVMVTEFVKKTIDGNKIRSEFTSFQKEFRKQMATLITGAFAFVAALLWRDAIKSYFEKYRSGIESIMPVKETWFIEFFTALLVSIVAVIAIVIITKLLSPKK